MSRLRRTVVLSPSFLVISRRENHLMGTPPVEGSRPADSLDIRGRFSAGARRGLTCALAPGAFIPAVATDHGQMGSGEAIRNPRMLFAPRQWPRLLRPPGGSSAQAAFKPQHHRSGVRAIRLLRGLARIQVVRPPLHQLRAVLQIGGAVIGRPYLVALLVRKLPLDHVGRPAA